MKRISKINKINKIENNLRQQEEPKTKTKSEKELDFDSMLKKEERKLEEKDKTEKNKKNTLDSYKIEIQKAMISQKKIPQIEEEQENEKY